MKVKTKAFKDQHGNCFVLPSLVVIPDHPQSPTEFDVTVQAIAFYVSIGEVDYYTPDWFEFDLETFVHIRTELSSPVLSEGKTIVYLFEGPIFDEIFAEQPKVSEVTS